VATRKPLASKAKDKPPGKNVAMTHDDEELPPERAADLARREAELERLLASGTLIETFRKNSK
jgi:hypothetical protein